MLKSVSKGKVGRVGIEVRVFDDGYQTVTYRRGRKRAFVDYRENCICEKASAVYWFDGVKVGRSRSFKNIDNAHNAALKWMEKETI